jgi:hypothetical protein
VNAPSCQFCGAEMQPLPADEARDRLDQSGLLFLPSQSFECVTDTCKARRIVTTVRSPDSKPQLYPLTKETACAT